MSSQKQLIIVNGKDRTDSVASYQYLNGKCNVVHSNSPKVYSYNSSNVRLLQLRQMIDPASVIVKAKGSTITNIDWNERDIQSKIQLVINAEAPVIRIYACFQTAKPSQSYPLR